MARPDPALLLYLRNHIEDEGFAPSIRETAAYFHIAVGTAHKRMQALVDAGYVERKGPRAIRITDQ